jgi:hypothetical protein
MTMTEFCGNNKFLPMKISVYNYQNSGDHPCYGTVVLTTRDIEMTLGQNIAIKNEKGKVRGHIKFN